MDQRNASGRKQGLPLSATDRRLWPSLKFTPPGQRPALEPGVVPVRCVEVLGKAGERAEQAGVRAGRATRDKPSAVVDYVTLPESPSRCHAQLLPDPPAMTIPALPKPAKRPGRGRPRILTPLKREVILKALSQGKPRTQAAKGAKVCPATIRLEVKRDVTFALDVQVAEEEGREFREVFNRLFVPGRVRLETEPVIGTAEFEREKEFLISRGLSRDWVSRMRLVREDEIEALAEYDEIRYRMAAKKGFRNDVEKALNFMAGAEIVETEFSPDGRQVERVKIHRRPPPTEAALASRVASLEMLLDLSPMDTEMLIAEMESRPWQCSRCRKKPKPPRGAEEHGGQQ